MPKKSGTSSGSRRPPFDLRLGAHVLRLGAQTKIMGVLNVTPDSFSDGGRYLDPGLAEERALRMQEEGAHLIDVGGESTRPGARPVTAREEIRRVRPVLRRLARRVKVPLSIDTSKDEVAAVALDEGATLVNDVRALAAGGRRLARRIARYGAAVALMHMRGTPETMQQNTSYRDLCGEIRSALRRALERALEGGIPPASILLDPGFGFGKSAEQNLEILSGLDRFHSLRKPLLIGLSRKSFIGHALGSPVEDRLYGSLGAAAAAVFRGAHILRVHDVLAHRQLCALLDRALAAGPGEARV